MKKRLDRDHASGPRSERASLSLRIGRHAEMSADIELTDRGIMAIAVLVSTTLLSTAILVRTAVRHRATPAPSPPTPSSPAVEPPAPAC